MADDDETEIDKDDEEDGDDPEAEPDADLIGDDVLDLDAAADDDDDAETDDEAGDETDDDDDRAARVRKRKAGEEEDDDDDEMPAPDDVEADLDTILKDRMVTVTDDDEGEDEEVEVTVDRSDAPAGIQPKRADEKLCPSCFLLVRSNAPGCPVEDDSCPIFT